jgi:hypothetical protein
VGPGESLDVLGDRGVVLHLGAGEQLRGGGPDSPHVPSPIHHRGTEDTEDSKNFVGVLLTITQSSVSSVPLW